MFVFLFLYLLWPVFYVIFFLNLFFIFVLNHFYLFFFLITSLTCNEYWKQQCKYLFEQSRHASPTSQSEICYGILVLYSVQYQCSAVQRCTVHCSAVKVQYSIMKSAYKSICVVLMYRVRSLPVGIQGPESN